MPTPLVSPQHCPRATRGACCLCCLNSSTLSSGYHEQGGPSPNMEDKNLLSQSTPLLAEFYSSVIKTRGTFFDSEIEGGEQPPLSGCLLPCLHQTKPLSCQAPAAKPPLGRSSAGLQEPPRRDRDGAGTEALP